MVARQLIDRVVLTYVKAGQDNGYFATVDDAEIFEHELTWMLLHQVFSFNSPVWFNVGTTCPAAGLARASSSPSTTRWTRSSNWYTEEGLIFKGGSGAGAQPLPHPLVARSCCRSGGTASGPVVVHARR